MRHIPVLLEETIALLAPERGGLFVDCTLGLGGHSAALLMANPTARVIGIDRDPEALRLAESRLQPFAERMRLLPGEFSRLEELLEAVQVDRVDGILADIGVSSLQLETAERGFSFRLEGPLDMRMGPGELTASEVVNSYREADLERIFRDYGEERQARRIARAIVARRDEQAIQSTSDLRQVVHRVLGRPPRHRKRRIDPATRVFQAIRIEVNKELSGLESLLDQAVRLLRRDGRLVVISYHSLEDRIVKNKLRDLARGEVDQITGRPRSETQVIEVLTKRPIRPGEAEITANPRSRSARLRAARRL
ncbi:MAG: 16S rRNA (cytosine(1402)-N(4))-methyltransferase RsmH [Bacteroidia bacterium]|nr:16S rRNA (cytosine(1402)-N(4))-methyltransferase RsmH [Bacteroidia bacterium]